MKSKALLVVVLTMLCIVHILCFSGAIFRFCHVIQCAIEFRMNVVLLRVRIERIDHGVLVPIEKEVEAIIHE